ncbi:matrixin family metalloprotease [Ruminiclostridium herbifermentans]|uniref:Matrixin family metalloprotease n=1 Tax=Ruminiclostridium herbifermentans TaxID=2488810 RepID=A0A7H1VMC6_9FIRM|nr:matrixin family metalloprotease [Ruminiclostridium herbifermentans]QNU66538.1 matrixin family metalloprotease [Ruminiclostridium herbifermentans]
MKGKKSIIASLILAISIIIGTTAYAANLGTLSYWYSNGSDIARWSSPPTTWSLDSNGFESSDFLHYVNHARGQWRDAGISINSTTDYNESNFTIRGGTYDIMHNYEPSVTTTITGTSLLSLYEEGTWTYGSNSKRGLTVDNVRCYIIYQPGGTSPTEAKYEKTVTHEMGHGLGWCNHSTSSSDVMYGSSSSVNTLTSRDKNHLTQIY